VLTDTKHKFIILVRTADKWVSERQKFSPHAPSQPLQNTYGRHWSTIMQNFHPDQMLCWWESLDGIDKK